MKRTPRIHPDLSFERQYGASAIVCGVDEVGRGPLAGPVMAAAVVLRPDGLPEEIARRVCDSKMLAKHTRELLAPLIEEHALAVAVGVASVEDILEKNILGATMLAMCRAVEGLGVAPTHALVDGNRAPKLPCAVETIVKGDGRSLSIAAASIVAKVARDRVMEELHALHPGYGWDRNAGYPTPDHLEALHRLGPTPHHRRGFKPVAALWDAVSAGA